MPYYKSDRPFSQDELRKIDVIHDPLKKILIKLDTT